MKWQVDKIVGLHSKGRLLALPAKYSTRMSVTSNGKHSGILLYQINFSNKKLYEKAPGICQIYLKDCLKLKT